MRGWILDLYPGKPGEMVVWLKDERGEAVRLVDQWSPSFYIAAGERADLNIPLKIVGQELAWTRPVQKQERITDQKKSEVLEAKVKDAKKVLRLASRIERLGPFGTYRLYNVDLPANQSYLYERDLFPLAYCGVSSSGGRLDWDLQDDVMEYDYRLPRLKTLNLDVAIGKVGRIPKDTDRIKEIRLKSEAEELVIEGTSEADSVLELVRTVRALDPDFITTRDGDAFLLPYLIKRAEANGVAERLTLDRDCTTLRLSGKKGTSFFSYGKIQYKPSAIKLYGRVHIDTSTSFSYSEAGLHGLFELSRICRMPLQTASRASIGKLLSSLQFYQAFEMDLLIPWKPTLAERFKDRVELLVADRGGFVFEPKMGLYEGVAELDFQSLYPNIMLKKNISAETVRCPCCPDSTNRVPELGWNVCRREGLVPKSMKIVVEKRLRYKELRKASEGAERDRYDQCQAALKWIGVTCLPRESPVFVKKGDQSRWVRIGEFIDSIVGDRAGVVECPPGVSVVGLSHDFKAKYSRVASLIKKPNSRKLLHIVMEDGREVTVTPDHPLFTLRGGQLETKAAAELKTGEVIPVAKRIPAPSIEITSIDLVERLKETLRPEEQRLWRVSGNAIKKEVVQNKQKLATAAVKEGYSIQSVDAWAESGILPLRLLELLDIKSHAGLRIGAGRRLGGRIAWLPAVLAVDEKLGFFLGLFVADGSATRVCVRIDVGLFEPDLLDTMRKVVESLLEVSPRIYKERKARMNVVQINSASLVRVLERVFDLPGSSERGKLKVPDFIFGANGATARGFIAGLIAGDGSFSKRRRFVSIATKSKTLQNQLGFLAARLGLAFRLANHRAGPRPLYTINFVGPETLERIKGWRFVKDAHRLVAESWLKESLSGTCTHARYERLPAGESGLFSLAKATRTSSTPHVFFDSSTCPAAVKQKISKMRTKKLGQEQTEQMERILKLMTNDMGFVRVRKVEEIDCTPEYVYCFQLEESELAGFVAGDGLVFVHNCFGYLGFNNAKFGRIDAHIAVCAWDRKILVDAARVAERRGYEVIHGIVDSLWLKRAGADKTDYLELKEEIEAETGFPLSFEGIYKWIAFLPSKVTPGLPVQNRYFGAYSDGRLKVRGIEARRHDTPPLFKRCQMEILNRLGEADSVAEAKGKVPECVGVFLKYARAIEKREVPAEEMAFAVNLSKKPEEYVSNTLQSSVANQLALEGADLHAGEGVRYVITDYRSGGSKRAVPADFGEAELYDGRRYIGLLADACATVLEQFDSSCTARWLVTRHHYG